jgi:hypothetical protein
MTTTTIKYQTTNDRNGSGRRVFVVYEGYKPIGIYEESGLDVNVIPNPQHRIVADWINVTPTEYKRLVQRGEELNV